MIGTICAFTRRERCQTIRRRGGPGSGDNSRPAGRAAGTAATRAGDRVKAEIGAGFGVGAATQATQQTIAFMALGAWLGVCSGEDWPVSWHGVAFAGDAEAPTAPTASTDRAPISSKRD